MRKKNELSEKLRSLCDDQGCELEESLQDSGQVLNELGLLYKTKSPDQISLIQSAALLNASIVRHPSNEKFQRDLEELCFHALECAYASQRKSNLREI